MPDLAGDDSDADAGLSVLLTPPALPDVPSVANLAPTDQENLGQSPEQRNGEVEGGSGSDASPSQTNSRPQLPPELAEPPPGPVDPMVQVRALAAPTLASLLAAMSFLSFDMQSKQLL